MSAYAKPWYRIVVTGLLLCFFFANVSPLWSQEPIRLRIDSIDDSNYPQMNVQVAVRNNNGVPVPELEAEDFEIAEDGVSLKPTQVQSVTNPEVELAVALVIDVSGSMGADDGKPLQDAKAAANAFLDTLSPDDQAAVIAFGDSVDLGEPFPRLDPDREHAFTYDKNALRNVINFLEAEPCAGTPLYDATYKAVKMTARQPMGNRAVILMTDGRDAKGIIDSAGRCREEPPGSEVTVKEDPIAEANRNNIPVFSIGLGENIDRGYLQRLALRTGGTYQQTPESAQLTALYKNIAELLKQQYVLTYPSQITAETPPVTTEGEHSLLVRASYGGAEAIDEVKFVPPLTPQPAPTSTSDQGDAALVSTPEPALTPTPAPAGVISDVMDTLSENRALTFGIGGLSGLAFILLLAFLVLRRREPEEDFIYPEAPTAWYDEGKVTPGEDAVLDETVQDTPLRESIPSTDVDMPDDDWVSTQAGPGDPGAADTVLIGPKPKSLGFFVMKEGSRRGAQLPLSGSRTSIGRDGHNDIVIDDPTVSRDHAVVLLEEDEFYIQDLGSANGTLVNGEEITKHKLEDEDEVTLGESVLRFKTTRLED